MYLGHVLSLNTIVQAMNTFHIWGWELSGGVVMMTAFLAMIAVGANARLFMKCSIPGWKAFVPGYNVVMAMKIIGRPWSHALFFLIPNSPTIFISNN